MMGEWLQNIGRLPEQPAVGIYTRGPEVAFATRDAAWVASFSDDQTIAELAIGMLKSILLTPQCPLLVSQDLTSDVFYLGRYLKLDGAETRRLVSRVIHDMRALGRATGIINKTQFAATAHGALDAAVVGPQMAIDAPRYYQAVGLPLAKHVASCLVDRPPGGAYGWQVIYKDLFLRVLAHLTNEPFLVRLFREEEGDALTAIGKLLEIPDRQEVYGLLMWLAMGEETGLVLETYPNIVLPDNAPLLRSERIDKKLPVLRLWLTEEQARLLSSPRTQSLYGRISPPGLSPGGVLHFKVAGSVVDIVSTVMTSIINLEERHHYMQSAQTELNKRAVIRGYTTREDLEVLEEELTILAASGNPLILPLGAQVVLD